jgi:osmotically-inducible protein OsmY
MNPRIMLLTCLVGVTGAAVAACEERSANSTTTNNNGAATTNAPPPRADNTANNTSDQNTGAPTPMDQSQDPEDIRITAEIRRAIMEDDTMSMNAQNCKIITANGVVTLRGVVASEQERAAIGARAQQIAGVLRVDNQLAIESDAATPSVP